MKLSNKRYAPNRKILLIILAMISIAAAFYFFRPGSNQQIFVTKNAVEMGTAVSLTVYAEKGRKSEEKRREQLSELASQILTLIRDLDRNILSWRSEDSEVNRFNHLGDNVSMNISPELAEVLSGSLEIAADSESAMDITLRPVIDLWGIETYDGKKPYALPSQADLEKVSASVGYDHLILTKEGSGKSKLEKNIPDLSLDLGAVGKGYALDIASGSLLESDAAGAVLAVGGSILVFGDKGASWQIGLRDPAGAPNDYFGILSFPGGDQQTAFISTSGGYEKYVEYEGKILAHIIDGRTLQPAESGLYSVTVVTKDSGLVSDGLSTACYILGIDASKLLLDRFHAEAVFVTRNNKIFLTDGLKQLFSLTNTAYSVLEMP